MMISTTSERRYMEERTQEIQKILKKLSSLPNVSIIVIFDQDGKILESNTDNNTAIEIANKSNKIIEIILSIMKKYGSKGLFNVLSTRISTDIGNIYVIKGKILRVAFLQKAALTNEEKKAIQIIKEIEKELP